MLASSEQEMREWIDILKSLLYYFKPSLALSDPTPSAEKKKGPNKIFLEGWLAKQGGNTKSWKNRWFLLRFSFFLSFFDFFSDFILHCNLFLKFFFFILFFFKKIQYK